MTHEDDVLHSLRTALAGRIAVEQARGALAQREAVSVDAALELMRTQALSGGHTLAAVAANLLTHTDEIGLGPQRAHHPLQEG